uniref:H15 domain-containing protein n=1 Tax=Varanus komodoensis TaxID=61221 RepID=A0A8D2IZ50_VARKO
QSHTPSCSGLNVKSTLRSKSKGREAHKPSFPWKNLLPRRGVSKLIFQVVASTEKRTGISLQAIKKSVAALGYDLEKRKNYFKRVLRALVAKGLLRKLTGRGLTGSYAISKMMMKVLRRRRRKRRRRRRRRRKRKAMFALKKKRDSKRRKRKRRSRRKKTKPRKSDPSDLCGPMSMT